MINFTILKKKSVFYFVAIIVIALDQWTKALALDHLYFAEPVAVWPFLNWTLLFNTGAAFSFLSDVGGWQHWVLGGFAIAVSIFIIVYLYHLPFSSKLLSWSLAFILGGALGNVYDRITLGYVVDFIDVYWPACSWGYCHWPAFNIADSAITLGAILLIIDTIVNPPPEKPQA